MILPPHFQRKAICFPFGFGYIAQYLLNEGHHVEVLDIFANEYSKEQVVDILSKKFFDFYGISAFSTQYSYVKWLTKEIKEMNCSSTIVVGGPLGSYSPDIVLNNTNADVCCIGEGEITFPDLIQNNNNRSIVKGIAFKEDRKIVKTEPREYISDLDSLPTPVWDLFPVDIYLKNNSSSFAIITSRGCPYNCGFCSRTFKSVRYRSVDNVMAEIKQVIKKYNIKSIQFLDELFVANKQRILAFCERLSPLNLKWGCQGRINLVDKDILKRMKGAGCVYVGYGVESGSQKILDKMDKKIKVEDSVRVVNETFDVGLEPTIQMMYGYLGENDETLEETISFFDKINRPIYRPQLSPLVPLPNSPVYEYAIKNNLITNEERYLDSLQAGYLQYTKKHPLLVNMTEFGDEEYWRNWKYAVDEIDRRQRKRFFYFNVINHCKNYYRDGVRYIIKKINEKELYS